MIVPMCILFSYAFSVTLSAVAELLDNAVDEVNIISCRFCSLDGAQNSCTSWQVHHIVSYIF